MPSRASHVNVLVFPLFRRRVTQRRLRCVAEAALHVAGAGTDAGEISVVIADDAALLELNERHRGEAMVTDVLSFSPNHAGPYLGDGDAPDEDAFDFPTPDGEAEELGEVVISYPQAKRQAREAGRPVAAEVEMLVAHGVLHLLGYDHTEPDEEREMFALQDAALERAEALGRPAGAALASAAAR
ncbi:MAG: rRNA maturation RNase YbeY [Chloroflexota bacterium]|nr:rRNA maturation RNase YbeY [Chloroflexota bacterium]MDE2968918.1 rRNA maturation RNase YbeY [Chloroflexota bacterium]